MKQQRRVYAMTGVAPERHAYAMAKYSRSAETLRESARELTGDRTRKFLNTMYFKYGHASIADMAHISMAVEQISIWTAIALVDEQLWDGQERSTRYQPFRETGYQEPEGAPCEYQEIAEWLMTRYETTFANWVERLQGQYPMPEGMKQGEYDAAIRARAFDIARYYLFLGVNTSVGQITSARVLERQIARMAADPLPEIRAVGAELKLAAAEQPAADLRAERLRALAEQAPEPVRTELLALLQPEPVAPTLIKYAEPSPYQLTVWSDVADMARQVLSGMEPENRQTVVLTVQRNPVDAAIAGLLYRVSDLAYHQILARVEELGAAQKVEMLDHVLNKRGPHDEWLREFQGGPLAFDILMDIGGYRDLHRHRRTAQIRQAFTTRHGAAVPQVLEGTADEAYYLADMYKAGRYVEQLMAWDPLQAHYLLPLGYKCRSLFKMDLAEAGYIIRLRSKEGGHFSYRWAAYRMYEELAAAFPDFARHVAFTHPLQDDPLKR